MGYYQGDFYAGARGDPFWGSLLSGATRIFQKVSGVGQKLLARGGGIMPGGNIPSGGPRAMVRRGVEAAIKHPVLSAAGAAGALGGLVGAESERMMMAPGMACPKGFHISKSKHSRGKCVRNRRMNVANGRALSRAVRRLHHFARKYKKVVGFVSPRKPKGRLYFRKKKRAA